MAMAHFCPYNYMFMDGLCISVSFPFVSIMDSILSPPVSKLSSIIPPYVYTKDSISSLFDITLTKSPTK